MTGRLRLLCFSTCEAVVYCSFTVNVEIFHLVVNLTFFCNFVFIAKISLMWKLCVVAICFTNMLSANFFYLRCEPLYQYYILYGMTW